MAVPLALSALNPSIQVSIGAKETCAPIPVRALPTAVTPPITRTISALISGTFNGLRRRGIRFEVDSGGVFIVVSPLLAICRPSRSSFENRSMTAFQWLSFDTGQRDPLNKVALCKEKERQN